ncbi:MAG: 2-C-methyl-D-erythritol 4-phosphate cytidylyltransferase [Candidatus Marinimicrobia bacterium]|nr:2-C-methyl-D-erythritol 4-phosphate cytidylyltransferase [Candidatus Neomarinimicrobiota bacterium]
MTRSTNHLAVIIPASGSGKRMKHSVPKPLIPLGNMSILERTIRRFFDIQVHEMILSVSENIKGDVETICSQLNSPFPIRIVLGGAQRQDSVWNALQVLDDNSNVVAIHDAARPFFNPEIISDAYPLLDRHAGVIAAIPATYTMKQVVENVVERTLPRETLWQINTPQIFHRDLLLHAYREANKIGFYGTDDAMLLEQLGESIAVIQDTAKNMKITTPVDLLIAEKIVKEQ